MGRRSRKRGGSLAREPRPPVADLPTRKPLGATPRRSSSRSARLGDPPKAPWAPVPLTEGAILIGVVLVLIAMAGNVLDHKLMLGFGLACMTIATAELSLREHFAGYRSHSSLLAGLATVAVTTPLVVVVPGVAKLVVIVVAAVLFVAVWQLLRATFRQRSGGASWRS